MKKNKEQLYEALSVLLTKLSSARDNPLLMDNYVTKALQLYLEGLSLREIERILGISHVTISSWIKEYNIKKPPHSDFHATYKVFKQIELAEYIRNEENLKGSGLIITEFGDKFMMIKWERFKK